MIPIVEHPSPSSPSTTIYLIAIITAIIMICGTWKILEIFSWFLTLLLSH